MDQRAKPPSKLRRGSLNQHLSRGLDMNMSCHAHGPQPRLRPGLLGLVSATHDFELVQELDRTSLGSLDRRHIADRSKPISAHLETLDSGSASEPPPLPGPLPPPLPSLHPLLHGKLTTCHRNHDPSLPLRYDAIQHPGYPIPSHAARHSFDASRYPGLQQPRLETWRQIPMGQSQIAHSHPRYAHHGSSADYVSRWPNLSHVAAVLLYICMRHLASRLPHYAIPCSTSARIALTTASNPLVFMSPYLSYTATYRYGYH
ncbi:hypothetical protein CSAL01_05523 [Colletotrichum salicis]|uniref:Uncharacterized protein n=1 Tax=Colletotrichum salicis TaxID=1209931 RepID=A0A135TTN2_9PEZI|nr:hypothetical protein CSAL01_05523 [Colletotrichum salicis]